MGDVGFVGNVPAGCVLPRIRCVVVPLTMDSTMMLGRHWCRKDSGKNDDSAQYLHGYVLVSTHFHPSSMVVVRSQNNPAQTRSRTVALIDLDAHFVSLAPDEGMVARRAGMRSRGAFVP